MSLPNYLSSIKSSGIYRFVWDKSEIEGVDAETLRLVVGYSEKGPFNTPVYVKSATDFRTIFGGISRKLEKRGVFFHRLALQALLSGPIIALNLKKFSNDPTSAYDKVEAVTLNAAEEMSDIAKLPVEGIYNKVRFWNLSSETARETYEAVTLNAAKYISIFAADDDSTSKSFIIRGYKPSGYDLTIRQWFSNFSEEMPDIYEPIADTLLNQYFAEIYVFGGKFTTSMAKSKELNKYFDVDTADPEHPVVNLKPYIYNAFGEKTDTLAALAADKNSNFVKMYRGTTLPDFKDSYNNYISLNLLFNSDNYLHKMIMDFNTELLDDPDAILKCVNTSGWYKDDLAGEYDHNVPTGLQACMDWNYLENVCYGNVSDDYYGLATGITILGNENIVPDTDILTAVANLALKEKDNTTPTEVGIDLPSISYNSVVSSVDGTYIATNMNILIKNGTQYEDLLLDSTAKAILSSIKKIEAYGTNLVAATDNKLYKLTNTNDTWNAEPIQNPTQATRDGESAEIGEIVNIYAIYNANSLTHVVYTIKYTDSVQNLIDYTIDVATDNLINAAIFDYTTFQGLPEGKLKYHYNDYKTVLTGQDENENPVFAKVDGYFIDTNPYAFKIDASTRKVVKYQIDAENNLPKTYTMSYNTKSFSSNATDGGEVQFLTMTNCYIPAEEGGVDNLIHCVENTGDTDADKSKLAEDYDTVEFYTDAFDTYGLEIGDTFLGKNNTIATLLSIEDYIANSDSNVAVKKYTFNNPLKFMVFEGFDTDMWIYGDGTGNPFETVNSAKATIVKLASPFGDGYCTNYKFTYLQGFEYSNPKPASTSQYDKLKWQWDILDTLTEYRGLRTGLTEKKDIDYRYIVDTFESFVESELKSRLSLLAKEKDNCLALLNFPFIDTFRKCTYTAFTDDKGQLDISFIPMGGNSRKNITIKFSLPSENNGASWSSFNTAVVLSDGTIKTTIPSAALVSNNFMEKYVSRQPYYIVAGPNYGRIADYQLVGPDFNFGRADLDVLEPFGVNCMVYVPRIGTYINSNQTAKQNPVTALSKINIRELVIYLQDEIEKLLQSYQWEFNNQTLRDTIKTKADTICENVKNNGGIYEYLNVCDSSNNPPEVVDNEMLVLSTSIEGARGAGKMVQELTLYKTGGLQAMINNG